MIVVVKNHPYSYDVENLAEIFFPYEKIKVLSQALFDTEDNILAVTEMSADEIRVEARVFEKVIIKSEKNRQGVGLPKYNVGAFLPRIFRIA